MKIDSGLRVVLLLAAGSVVAACGGGGDPADPSNATVLPPVLAVNDVVADGVVVPVRHASLSFSQGGQIVGLPVSSGDEVSAGAVLARVDGSAEAAEVVRAETELEAAELAMEDLVRGATSEDIAAAEAAVDAARAGVMSAAGALASAGASRDRVSAGASNEDIDIAERRAASVRNLLWGAQARRDAICGRVEKKLADQADCDGAEAEIGRLYEDVRIAEIQLADLRNGARVEDVRVAQAGVQSAAGQREAASAGVRESEARLARLRRGATAAEIAAAKARIDGARAVLETARVRMDRAVLRAPFDGVVATLDVRPHEYVPPGTVVVRVADTSDWRIETDDLSELSVVHVAIGDRVTIEIDALDDVALSGRVVAIDGYGTNKLGDITYRVVVEPEDSDPRLRWNMTASVTIHDERD